MLLSTQANGADASLLRAEVESSYREGLSTQPLRVEGCLCLGCFPFDPLGWDSGPADLGTFHLRLGLRDTERALEAYRP